MIWLLFCFLFAQPLIEDNAIHPSIEYAKTREGRDVYWIEDRRHRIVRIRVQFDSGVGECASFIQRAWNHHHNTTSKKLLNMGGYARFWMGKNTSFIEISVFESHEKQGLRWIRALVDRTSISDVVNNQVVAQDIVMDVLYDRERIHVDRHECIEQYQYWKKSHTPQFLLVGAIDMRDVLPFLNFFWSESTLPPSPISSTKRTERAIRQYSIVEDDLGAQVELHLLVPLPKIDATSISAYQHVLDGGFGGRLMTRLREENGWVYDVQTKIHYGVHTRLEISTRCNIEDLLVVRDEIFSILNGMNQILPEEMERYRWSLVKQQREESLLGMPLLVSLIQKKYTQIPSKDLVEEFAKSIDFNESLWILRGRSHLVQETWPVEWNHVSFDD